MNGEEADQTPHASAIIAESVRLDLGQADIDTSGYRLPEEYDGPDRSPVRTTGVRGGVAYDPPLVTVTVYAGMEFEDSRENRTVTVDRVQWFAYREDDTLSYATPDDPTRVIFEEPEKPEDADSPRLELTGNDLAARIAAGRYVLVPEADREQ